MKIPIHIFFSLKYIHYKNLSYFNKIHILSIMLSMSFGSSILITAISILDGFHNKLKNNLVNTTPHITISNYSKRQVCSWNYILNKIKQKNYTQSIIPDFNLNGLILKKKAYNIKINSLNKNIRNIFYKKFDVIDGFFKDVKKNTNSVYIGYHLAINLNVWVNDIIGVVIFSNNSSFLQYKAKVKYLKIKMIFDINNLFNNSQIFIDILDIKRTLKIFNNINVIHVKVRDAMKANIVAKEINTLLNNKFQVKNWINGHYDIFNTIKIEKIILFILVHLIYLFVSYSLFCNLFVVILNKKLDISILKTLGVSNKSIIKTFLLVSIAIGLISTTLGIFIGILLTINISVVFNFIYNLCNLEFYYLLHLNYKIPFIIKKINIFIIFLTSTTLCLLSILYPAFKIYKNKPYKILNE